MTETPAPTSKSHSKRVLRGRGVIILSVLFGILGGLGGSYLLIRYFPGTIPVSKQSILLQQSSAAVDVSKKVSPSVVSITSQTTAQTVFGAQDQQAAGTGLIVSSDGLIMTNNHVISGASSLTVYTNDGKQYENAQVVARDTQNDLAFIQIKANGLKPAELGDSGDVQVGTAVLAIGNALGQYQNTVTQGIISGIGRPVTAGDQGGGDVEQLQNLFQTDAAINPGNSGGPLVDLNGKVIGINTAVAGDAQGVGFAIPINLAKRELANVKSSGKISRPYLGVRYVTLTKEYATSKNLSVSEGAYITGDQNGLAVIQGSPADKAGLKDGDIIIKVDGQTLKQDHSLSGVLTEHNAGDKVKLTYIRDGKQQTVTVALSEAPQAQ